MLQLIPLHCLVNPSHGPKWLYSFKTDPIVKSSLVVCSVELQCDSCSRMFLEAWFLKQHQLRVHSGAPKRVFQCSDAGCEKTFTTHFNLENHVVSDHEGKMAFSCTHEGCGKHFAMQVGSWDKTQVTIWYPVTSQIVLENAICLLEWNIWCKTKCFYIP